MLLELLFAAAEFGAPLPTQAPAPAPPATVPAQPAPAGPVHTVATDTGEQIPQHETVIATTMTFEFEDDGWVTFADGTRKCVNGAPCGANHDLPPDAYTYNFETGVYYAADVTRDPQAAGQ